MLLADVVAASDAVRATSGRLAKVAVLADALRRLGPDEAAAGASFLAGSLGRGTIGVGWASLRELPPPAAAATLTVRAVDDALAAIGALAGPGSQAARRDALVALFAAATPAEQEYLTRLVLGDVRQGASEAVLVDAVARAADVPREEVSRALMLGGALGPVAALALGEGAAGLRRVGLEVGRPVQPMLAAPAEDLAAALERTGRALVEAKLDGARVQVHRRDGEVRVFTRSLDEITPRVPELVEGVLGLPVRAVVLDGEAIALRPDGRPHPFQVTASRFGSSVAVEELRRTLPLSAFYFDVLHLDGVDLIDRPATERVAALDAAVPDGLRVRRVAVEGLEEAAAFERETLARGHEGVMVKAPGSPYAAGRRGAGWLKVKPRHTLDLVVLAAEWGHGRRQGWLSNLHLAARADDGEGFVMLGKTFKGLTDAMLAWQTERLLALEVRRTRAVVHVRPELVVEIAFDGVQTSSRYPGGVALRFARVLRHRPDKRAADADTLAAVLAVRAS